MLLETTANLCTSRRQANDFLQLNSLFLSWEVYITKDFKTGSAGNSEFCFPETEAKGQSLRVSHYITVVLHLPKNHGNSGENENGETILARPTGKAESLES